VERVEDAIGWDCHFAHLVCVCLIWTA
jgi:hypothetical protein